MSDTPQLTAGAGLDFEIAFRDDEWQVWTPDFNGGIIGLGKTEAEAKADAVINMKSLCEVLIQPKPDAPKQLTADEVLAKLNEIGEFSVEHPDEWRNEVARDLGRLCLWARYWMKCSEGDQMKAQALRFSDAVIRIVERVAEFECIQTVERKPA